MVLVWRIADNSPNSPNFPPPNFPAIRFIKEGLVFQKFSGALIGYQDLGEINNILHDAKSQSENPGNCNRPLAKRMLVLW